MGFVAWAASADGADARALKLVMLGDSVTLSSRAPEGSKLPQLVQKGLNEASGGRVAWTVVNAGVGGETAEGGSRRVSGVLNRETPQLITVSYGLNDSRKKDPAWFATQMRALLDTIAKHPSKPQVVVLTASPFVNERHFFTKDPFYAGVGGLDAFLDRQLNAATRKLAAERGLPLIDVHRAFLRAPEWQKLILPDGVHLTPEGNRVVAAEVSRALAAFVEARSNPKSKAAIDEKAARAKLDLARKALADPAKRADAQKLLAEAAALCPYLADIWVAMDEAEAPAGK